jgi:branched-chain amino acid transport system substrate-binding protein
MKIRNVIITLFSAIALLISASTISFAKVVGNKIILGAAISLTGKYSSNGVHTQNGYNLAVDRMEKLTSLK